MGIGDRLHALGRKAPVAGAKIFVPDFRFAYRAVPGRELRVRLTQEVGGFAVQSLVPNVVGYLIRDHAYRDDPTVDTGRLQAEHQAGNRAHRAEGDVDNIRWFQTLVRDLPAEFQSRIHEPQAPEWR